MAKSRGDYTDNLIRNKVLTNEQILEAEEFANSTGLKLQDALVKQGYASANEVLEAMAQFHGIQSIDLSEVEIPKAVIELMPEAIARKTSCFPWHWKGTHSRSSRQTRPTTKPKRNCRSS